MAFLAPYAAPIAGALIGGLTGYMSAPEDNKLGGAVTGGLLGGLTGGIGGLTKGLMGAGKLGAAASTTGRMANSSWNPVSLLKSAYTPDASGLINLGMDAIPLISDIANNDVGLKSFTGFAGTMAGTKFGGRELNDIGRSRLQNSRDTYNNLASSQPKTLRNEYVNNRIAEREKDLLKNPVTSRQGYNMGIGMGADIGLYSLTSGLNKPKDPMESQLKQQQEFSNSPVSRYIQMTGAL